MTAQMDLETAEKLQRELADFVAKKRQNRDFHYKPRRYDPSLIPVGEIKGVDENGMAIIELPCPGSNHTEIFRGPTAAP